MNFVYVVHFRHHALISVNKNCLILLYFNMFGVQM